MLPSFDDNKLVATWYEGYPGDLKPRNVLALVVLIEIYFAIQTTKFFIKFTFFTNFW